jgi:hypothetical protein
LNVLNSLIRPASIVATLAAFLVSGSQADEKWRIEAGQVELSAGKSPWVRGSFYVHAPTGTPPDATPRAGGACLVTDLVAEGVGLDTCKTNADCNSPRAIDKAGDPALEAYVGYCLARDGSTQPPRCWTRPGPPATYCQRTVDGLKFTAGEHHLGPVPADPLDTGDRRLKWAVMACMADEGHPKACGDPEGEAFRQISFTPIRFD